MKESYFLLIIVMAIFLLACSKPLGPAAEIGDKVTIEYTAKLNDGTIFERSADYPDPITFIVGQREVLPGLEKAVVGMHIGEEKNFILAPEAAFGLRDQDLVRKVSLEELPHGQPLREGMVLTVNVANGKQQMVTILKITSEGALLDFNHPLAGEALWIDMKVADIVKLP